MSDDGDEELVIKPSTELIADEYEHFKNTTCNIAVHTFASKTKDDEDSVSLFLKTMNENDYKVDVKNSHCLDSENLDEILDRVCDSSKDLDGLILFFSCFCKEDGMINVFNGQYLISRRIQDVVTKFTTYNCPGLKNKPKIFIFHVKSTSLIQVDSLVRYSYDLTYDTPAEADMLIVYKKTEYSNPVDFTKALCTHIKEHGRVEDIFSLITFMEYPVGESRPLVISTLTRMFYFTLSEYRGHHFHIHVNHKEIRENLADITSKLSEIKITRKKPRPHSFRYGNNSKKFPSSSNSNIDSNELKKKTIEKGADNRISTTRQVSIAKSRESWSTKTASGTVTKNTTTTISYNKQVSTAKSSEKNASDEGDTVAPRKRVLSVTKSDGIPSNKTITEKTSTNTYIGTRGSRSRLESAKSDGGFSTKSGNDLDTRPRWKF